MSNQNARTIPSLDGFRAVSIFWVIISHMIIYNNLPLEKGFMRDTLQSLGITGVRIFFVISGFLITYLLLKERNRYGKIDLKKFYLRRMLRIFPVFYAYLLVILILNQFHVVDVKNAGIAEAALYIYNFYYHNAEWLVGHSWSLAVEEQFYLLWPFIMMRLKKITVPFIGVVILLAVTARGIDYKYTMYTNYFLAPFFKHVDFLFAGCLLAYIYTYHTERLEQFIRRADFKWSAAAMLIIFGCTIFEYHPVFDKVTIPFCGLIMAVMIAFLIAYYILKTETAGYTFLNLRPVKFIGTLSYSIYVWQQLFFGTGLEKRHIITAFPLNIVLIAAAALLSYYLIEKPFLKLKDRFTVKPLSQPASSYNETLSG